MSRSVATTVKCNPLFIASTALGIFPFKIANSLMELDRLLLCYSVFVVTIISFMGIFTVVYESTLDDTLQVTLKQIVILQIIQYPCSLGLIFVKRAVLQETVASLQNSKSIFYKMKLKISKNWSSKVFELFDTLQPIIFLLLFYITGNFLGIPSASILFILFTVTGSSLYFSQFCFLVGIVSRLFEAEINVLKMAKRTVYRNVDIKMLEKLIETANQIISTARSINSIYSFQFLFMFFQRFLTVIMHMFSVIINITKGFSENYHFIIGDIFMMFHHLYNSWKVIHASEMASKKSKEFNTLLYQLMIDDTTNEILHNDKLRLHISMKREVVFTACGFFNLDYTLVHSMIASATTYLVILIQFGQSGSAAPESLPTVITNLTTTPLPLSLTTYQ
ncbi:Gustatory receptor 43k [Halyomorpha halys]|nr:Gustatory receptor 43k [Halyomorpha halys]